MLSKIFSIKLYTSSLGNFSIQSNYRIFLVKKWGLIERESCFFRESMAVCTGCMNYTNLINRIDYIRYIKY